MRSPLSSSRACSTGSKTRTRACVLVVRLYEVQLWFWCVSCCRACLDRLDLRRPLLAFAPVLRPVSFHAGAGPRLRIVNRRSCCALSMCKKRPSRAPVPWRRASTRTLLCSRKTRRPLPRGRIPRRRSTSTRRVARFVSIRYRGPRPHATPRISRG